MQECDFKIHQHNRNDEENEQIKDNSRTEKDKVAEPENNNEEEIEKNEKIFMVESQSEDYEKKLKQLGKQTMRNRQLRNKQ